MEQSLEQQAQAWLERRNKLAQWAVQSAEQGVEYQETPAQSDPMCLPEPLRSAVLRLLAQERVAAEPLPTTFEGMRAMMLAKGGPNHELAELYRPAPQSKLPRRLGVAAAVGAVMVAALVLLQLPDKVVVGVAGEVEGYTNQARAAIHGARFWQHQLDLVERSLRVDRSRPQWQAELRQASAERQARWDASREERHRAHPGMRPSETQLRVDALRAEANAMESAETDARLERFRLERIAKLERIRAVLMARLTET